MRSTFCFFIYHFLFNCFFSPLEASPNLGISVSEHTWTGGGTGYYDPNDSAAYEQSIYFDVTFDPGDSGDFFVTFSPGINSSSFSKRLLTNGREKLKYQLYRDAGKSKILKEPPSAKKNDVIAGSLSSGDIPPRQMTCHWFINSMQNKDPGTYTDTVEMSIYEGRINGSYSLADGPYSLDLTTVIPELIYLSIIPKGASFDEHSTSQQINFGELEEGESGELNIRVLSNTGYEISMESANGSALANTSGYPTTIPYTVKINNKTKDLSSGNSVVVASKNKKSPKSGDRYRFKATIGSLEEAFPEYYSDTISVSVAPN